MDKHRPKLIVSADFGKTRPGKTSQRNKKGLGTDSQALTYLTTTPALRLDGSGRRKLRQHGFCCANSGGVDFAIRGGLQIPHLVAGGKTRIRSQAAYGKTSARGAPPVGRY